MAGQPKVFILGSPRSGTSIMYFAMREVIGLPGQGESHVVPLFTRLMHAFHLYVQDFRHDDGVLAADLDSAAFRQTLYTFLRNFFHQSYGPGGFVDKTPGAEAIAGCEFILGAFPDAKILLLQRNGIEVVKSYTRKFGVPFRQACESWSLVVEVTGSVLAGHPDVLTIDQFDLSGNPRSTARRIADYLDSGDRADALASYFTSRQVEKQFEQHQGRRLTLADVDWTSEERADFVEICGRQMTSLGYSL